MKAKKLLTISTLALLLVACGGGQSEGGNSSENSSESIYSESYSNIDNSSELSVIPGQVGNLTSAMIETIANPSITVTGTLVDYYVDGDTNETYTTEYNMKVEMADGAWAGSYWIDPEDGEKANITTNNYRRGSVINDGTVEGASLDRVYINKNNVATTENEVLYDGTPLLWANNHLWNHLGELNINKFVKDEVNGYYTYSIDPASTTDYSADQYLMTYLGYSLTPLYESGDGLIDTLNVYCDDEKITRIDMLTEVAVLSTDEEGNPVDQSWSAISLELSEIGTTLAPSLQPYEAGPQNDKLATAISKMKGITNYTFHAVETTTSAPSTDSGDYVIESTDTVSSKSRKRSKVANYNNNTGTIGRVGKVTENAILYEDTGKYNYGMDDNLYHISYSGLKQNDDNTYESFEYDANQATLVGKRKYIGNMFDKMPSFDFAPEVFVFDGGTWDKDGNALYRYVLRDATIAYQVAPEISSHSYADDATSSVNAKFSIMVDDQGNFVSTSFPYNLVSGTYLGTITTSYSNIGTTTLDADLFDGYVARVVAQNWNEFADMDFYETNLTSSRVTKPVSEVLSTMFGEGVDSFITPKDITDVFGDKISGPWHDKVQKRDSAGEYIDGEYYDEFTFNLESVNLDKNNRITDWRELMDAMGQKLAAKGYQKSAANSMDTLNTKFETFTNGEITIVFENIGYKTIYVTCMVSGNWTLNR